MTRESRPAEEVYGPALEKAAQDMLTLEPFGAAARSGVAYEPLDGGQGRFSLSFLGVPYHVGWPGATVVRATDGEMADVATRLILLHYLLTADGTPPADQWIAFRNLPGGMGYDAAFQGRGNVRLARTFGTRRAAFEAASRAIGGEPLSFGDASFAFQVLPHLSLAVVLNLADDEFPAHANVLFDASASHYLPTEDLAVLGGMLSSRLCKSALSW